MFSNNVIKALSNDKKIRIIICALSDIIDKIAEIHAICGKNKKLFSDSAVGTVLLGCDLKNDGTNISSVLRSSLSSMSAVVIFDSEQSIRGYFKNGNADNGGFESLKGDGSLTIMCDDGKVGLYTSTVPLNNCSMEESLNEYLRDSQQHEGILRLSEENAVGVMILPVLNSEITYINDRRDELNSLVNDIFRTKNSEYSELLAQHGFTVLSQTDAHWSCNCNRENMQNVVLSLGQAEAYDIINEVGNIEIICPYCKTKYVFNKEQVNELFNSNK